MALDADVDLELAAAPGTRAKPRLRAGWAWAASLALHVAGAIVGGEWALHSLRMADPVRTPARGEGLVAVDLPVVAESSIASETPRDPVGEVPHVSGGPTVARVDTARDGRGGTAAVAAPATHLSDLDERLRLSRGIQSRLDRDQVQRVRSQATRASWEDRRSTTHPMDLTFLSSGDLERLERRAVSSRDPSRGTLISRSASAEGGLLGLAAESGSELAGVPGTAHEGAPMSAPGEGVKDGAAGLDHRVAAAVAHARPSVALAPVSVEAIVRARPRDDVDSEQEVAAKVDALVHASTAGGVLGNEGVGGTGGGGAPGALGQAGAGSHPTPLGDGVSDWFDVSSTDPRIVAYFRRFHAKVDPLWANAFPKSAMLELKQGTVILEVTIAANGTAHVSWPPARPSGVDEFDRNCAEAVRKASPFDPIPKGLGVTTLRLRAPFVATNPIVH